MDSWVMQPGHRLKLCIDSTTLISAGCSNCQSPHLPKPKLENMFTIWHRSLENQPDAWWKLHYTGILLTKGQQFPLTRRETLWTWICLLWQKLSSHLWTYWAALLSPIYCFYIALLPQKENLFQQHEWGNRLVPLAFIILTTLPTMQEQMTF